MAGGRPGGESPTREQFSSLRSLLVLFVLLTQQDSQASILNYVANAVGSLGPCQTQGIFLDGQWQGVRVPGQTDESTNRPAIAPAWPASLAVADAPVTVSGVPWSWAYSLSSPGGPSGYLVVGAQAEPSEHEQFLLQVLAQQAGVALANARLHLLERQQAAELRAANLALARSLEIHARLTKVAIEGEGHDGIAQAVYELTDRAAAIEDRFGNLLAWAGPGRPDSYPKDDPVQRDRFVGRMAAGGLLREGDRLFSVALLGGVPAGVFVLHDPDGTAGDNEWMALEHATTVLVMEIARLRGLAEADNRLRSNLVLDVIADAGQDPAAMLSHAQALGYDLGRPHRIVIVDAPGGALDIELFFQAVIRATRHVEIGSLLAPRLSDVVVLADTEASWDGFRECVDEQVRGGRSRIGVGGRYSDLGELPRSYREAQLALQIQKTIGGPEQVTSFGDLGVYQMLASADDTSAVEQFVRRWLGRLIDYDAIHGTQLVLTLSEYLDCGGNYDASARALCVHRSTLKYRLRRIRQVSGYDLGHPDTQFNLQLATRAWRTVQALRQSLSAALTPSCLARTSDSPARDDAAGTASGAS